jgi:hypothetical protein
MTRRPRYPGMDLRRLIILALVLAAACGPTSTPRAVATASGAATSARTEVSASPQANGPAEGVLMLTGQGQLGGTTSTKYTLYVITADGRIVRSVTAGIQSAGWFLPRFSVAGHSVYFLDGDRDLKVLRNDGSVGEVGQLPGGAADRVIFAVSPDEQQIAYTLLHYAAGGATTTSFRVGVLASLNVHEIFSGSPIEFPIGWLSGRLVVAITPHSSIQNPGEVNPYFADAYHIVDPVTAHRIYSTPSTGGPQGPVNAAGTVWAQPTGLLALDLKGNSRQLGSVSVVPPAVLNPDGQSAAVAIGDLSSGTTTTYPISLLSAGTAKRTAATGTPAGWFDANHLLFITACCQPLSAAVLDVSSNSVTAVASGLTGEVDPFAPFFLAIPNNLV